MPTFKTIATVTVSLLAGGAASFALAAFAGSSAAPSAMPPVPPRGESYACYPVDKEIQPIQVTLNDQFGSHFFTAYHISRLCTPASRRPDWAEPRPVPISDLHYVCYLIKASTPLAMTAIVVTNNEFSNDRLEIKSPTEFCLPSTKKKV
jgi:hypothetical protein